VEGAVRPADADQDEPPDERPQPDGAVVRRRELLRRGFWTGVGVLAVGGLAAALDFLNPHSGVGPHSGIVRVPAKNVPKPGGEPYYVSDGRFWLVNLKPGEGGWNDQFSHFAPSSQKGGLLALYQKCTHLGCAVPWRPDYEFSGVTGWFSCPCHTAIYTKAGLLAFGLALRSMDTFAIVDVFSGGVSVNINRLKLGGTDDPQRTVPAGPFA
jgi:cytochrome b6-f complex iron-sulfur subunit